MNASGHPMRASGNYHALGHTALGNTTCGVLLFWRTLYTGAKELSYPACRNRQRFGDLMLLSPSAPSQVRDGEEARWGV